MFMPKWQQDDYYTNNFRLNKGDAITVYYKDSVNAAATAVSTVATPFLTTGEMSLEDGATALGLCASIAFAAAALTF